jgi:two-component system response regulator DevR
MNNELGSGGRLWEDAVRVFLVDDSILIRQRLARMLSSVEGVQVVGEALEAREASTSIMQLQPDVVILDIQLLNGTGMEVLQDIKKMEPAPSVIIVTNFPEFRSRYLNAGADFFFDKSTEFHQIPLVVGTLVKQKQSERKSDVSLN